MVDQDGGYKRLFSEPRMMQDLLTEQETPARPAHRPVQRKGPLVS